jgi:hypothetical protein
VWRKSNPAANGNSPDSLPRRGYQYRVRIRSGLWKASTSEKTVAFLRCRDAQRLVERLQRRADADHLQVILERRTVWSGRWQPFHVEGGGNA